MKSIIFFGVLWAASVNADQSVDTSGQSSAAVNQITSNIRIVEGDILTTANSGRRALIADHPLRLWADGIVPYRIHSSLPVSSVSAINSAIAYWNEASGVSLVPVEQVLAVDPTLNESTMDLVEFQPGDGCASWIGRRGGLQEIWVAPNCTKGTMMHEIGHVLGLEHEHTRLDRDQYITVLWDNISEDKRHNFDLATSLTHAYGEYDYGSIMHYGPYNFSAAGKATIKPIHGSMDVIGQRSAPSAGDLKGVAELYSADLSIVAHLYTVGQGSEAAIHVSNDQGGGAHAIEVNVSLSRSRLRAYSDNGWQCDAGNPRDFSCSLERLAASSSSVLLLDLEGNAEDELLHAQVRSKTPDANLGNNTDEADVQAVPVLAASFRDDAVSEKRFGGGVSFIWCAWCLLLLNRKTAFWVKG